MRLSQRCTILPQGLLTIVASMAKYASEAEAHPPNVVVLRMAPHNVAQEHGLDPRSTCRISTREP